MADSLYGILTSGGSNGAKPRPAADDMFSEPAGQAQAPAPAPAVAAAAPEEVAAGPAPGPAPAPANAAAAAGGGAAALPQSFSAAKLMMPPVRRKVEPSKRTVPALDIKKLQEEKEALMRQRAANTDKPGGEETSAATGSASGISSALATPASGASPGNANLSLYGSPDEEYDPAKPNDYDEFCRRRMRQKAEEEMERRRQDAQNRQQQAAKPPEPKEDDFATKMMKKMGWKEGSGLGKDSQGMSTPLVLQKTDRLTGRIVEGNKREAPAAQAQPEAKQAKAAPALNRAPTRVLLLKNLVGAGEVDEDLEEETAEEAGKYGKIKKCVIKELKGVPDDQAVRIFLEYETVGGATKAFGDMNGRYFGGRVVKAMFFDEERFAKGDLDKKGDE